MIFNFIKVTKFIPDICVNNIYEIDYNKLYSEGKRIILFDLDNTLLPYDVKYAYDELKNKINELRKIGFEVMIASNNNKKRVGAFCLELNMKFVASSKKPFKFGFKKALRILGIKDRSLVVAVGDQIMTDVLGANRMKFTSVLVRPIKKSTEKWYTKFNRNNEKRILKRIKKYNEDTYKLIEEKHEY